MAHILKKLLLLSIFLSITIGAYAFSGKPVDDANCQGAWLFTEGSGATVADSSQNSNTGAFTGVGEPAWASITGTNAPSYADYMVTFDGDNDKIVASIPSIGVDADFAISVWAYNPASPTSRLLSIGGGARYKIQITSEQTYIRDSGGVDRTVNYTTMGATWKHFVLNRDGINYKPYIDGVERDSDDWGNAQYAADEIAWGCRLDSGQTYSVYSVVTISETGYFNRKLTLTEINDIMDNGLAGAVVAKVPQRMWNRWKIF